MKKILIVDDAKVTQAMTSDILSTQYNTVCASSGEEALMVYKQEKPDMILSDLVMPCMSGMEMQSILYQEYQKTIPMIFMSADNHEENESLCFEAGAMDYVRKPFRAEVLLQRVNNVMRYVEAEERVHGLKTAVETDPMTKLLNKSRVEELLSGLCAKYSGALIMVDIDSFKLVNDIHGHSMGDRMLIRFADILRTVTRSSDVAGRVGGDEFILFFRDIHDEAIIAKKASTINQMVSALAIELLGENNKIPLGASIGAVFVPEEGTDFPALYQKADKALYSAKQKGKHGCFIYHSTEMHAEDAGGAEHLEGVESIRKILEERNRVSGAYRLGFENFEVVYRYIARSLEKYQKSMLLVLITLRATEKEAETVEQFGSVLIHSLRRSDVVTSSGKNQFIVVLTEIEEESSEMVLERILNNWHKAAPGNNTVVSFETTRVTT